MDPILIAYGCAVVVTAIGAFTDIRTGHIPNWLTLPPLVIAPLAYLIVYGVRDMGYSIAGILVCGLVPYLMFRRQAMAGGDVKLFAAVGAIIGFGPGIEAQFISFIVASLYALGRLAWHGKLFRTLANSAYLGLNPVLPKKYRREVTPELMHRIRLGGAIFAGTAIAVFLRMPLGRF